MSTPELNLRVATSKDLYDTLFLLSPIETVKDSSELKELKYQLTFNAENDLEN